MAATSTSPALASDRDESLPGGGFLVAPVPRDVFSREDLEEEQRLFVETCRRFIHNEVWPRMDEVEAGAKGSDGRTPLVVELTRQAGDIGLVSIEIPAEDGGLGLDLVTGLAVMEEMQGVASFAATAGAHSGIGTLPIVYFGSAEQRARYLPKLASAEVISCYCLTEPGNGSDALWGKATAVRAEDGSHYVLNGQKQFITNGGFADVGVVFANVDGKWSALVVDLHAEGVARGAEEKKMGICGSSTTGLVFQDVKVPAGDLLGAVGDGPKIALNILYVGRMKLGFATMGSCKLAIDLTVKFASERKQFGRPVIEFDLQQAKLAEMTAWTYGADSLCYRVAGRLGADLARLPDDHTPLDEVAVMRRYGLECAEIKVLGSETLSDVLYHAVRMHGGYGFCAEYHVERLARDNVVDTIYEGTNDINRVVLAGALAESVYGGTIPFRPFLEEVHRRLREDDLERPAPEGYLGAEVLRTADLKTALAWAIEQVFVAVGKDLKNEQQVTLALADALISVHRAESAVARTISVGADHAQAAVRTACCRLLLHEAAEAVARRTREALEGALPEWDRPAKRATLDRLLAPCRIPTDVVALKRRIARHVLDRGRYDLE